MADPGQLVALMGSRLELIFNIFYVYIFKFSGAGKTSLLNTLLNRNLKNLSVSGQVLVNGHELGRSITYVSGVSSFLLAQFYSFLIILFKYIQQDELFMGTLTVKEHLMIQAKLRLVGFNERQIKKRVNEVGIGLLCLPNNL